MHTLACVRALSRSALVCLPPSDTSLFRCLVGRASAISTSLSSSATTSELAPSSSSSSSDALRFLRARLSSGIRREYMDGIRVQIAYFVCPLVFAAGAFRLAGTRSFLSFFSFSFSCLYPGSLKRSTNHALAFSGRYTVLRIWFSIVRTLQ